MSLLTLTAAVAALVGTSLAYDPSTHSNPNGGISLTSFTWCKPESGLKDCYYPPNTWPWRVDGNDWPFAAIRWNVANYAPHDSYNISWKDHDPQYPVRVQWHYTGFGSALDSTLIQEYNTTTLPAPNYMLWNPDLTSFPNNQTNLTGAEVLGYAGLTTSWIPQNYISIDQPEKPDWNAFTSNDVSDPFVVLSEEAVRFGEGQSDTGFLHRLRLGLGIGLGLGIPLLIAVTVMVTRVVTKRRIVYHSIDRLQKDHSSGGVGDQRVGRVRVSAF